MLTSEEEVLCVLQEASLLEFPSIRAGLVLRCLSHLFSFVSFSPLGSWLPSYSSTNEGNNLCHWVCSQTREMVMRVVDAEGLVKGNTPRVRFVC